MKNNKKLEYHFFSGSLQKPEKCDYPEDTIDRILSPSSPKSSCWWSNLTTGMGLKGRVAKIMRRQRALLSREEQVSGSPAFDVNIKSCPAVNDVLFNSFLIKAPCDLAFSITKDGEFNYDCACNLFKIESHHISQFHTEKNNVFEGLMNIKFMFPVLIRTKEVPLMYLQPMYHNNSPFMVVNGTIAGKYTKSQPLNLNVMVEIPKTSVPVSYSIKKGDILAYLWSPHKLELLHKPKDIFNKRLIPTSWDMKSMF